MRGVVVVLGLLLAACDGGHAGGAAGANPLVAATQATLPLMFRTGEAMENLIPMIFLPEAAAENGVVITPNGNPTDSLTVHFPMDADGDGGKETMIDGTVEFDGLALTATLTMDLDGDRTLTGTFAISLLPDGGLRISGEGTLTDATTGITMDFAISPLNPIVARTPDASSVANLCAYSVSGVVQVEAQGPEGSYSAVYTLAHDQQSVQVTDATSTDDAGATTEEPDSTFVVPCETGALSDWVGTYDFDWFCLPPEDGDSLFVITLRGNTIHIDDEGLEYDATPVPGNPHVVRGFFIDQDYREDFVWKLSADGSTFTQQSVYEFLPPLPGGGVCGGIGIKR